MFHLALYLLSPPRLERDGEPVHVRRRKVVALLAYLAVTGRPHSRETLVTLLSPEFDTSRARAELRRALSVLNNILGEGALAADRETVSLHADCELWLDVGQFRRLLAECEAHGHASDELCSDCLPLLEEATELYCDDFMAGFNLPDSLQFEEWQFFQAEELRNQQAGALRRLVHWHDAQSEHEPAAAYTRRWLELDPTNEPVHRQLMQSYAQAGRRGAALRQYRACVRVLEQELGAEPAAETTALYHRIRSGEVGDAVAQPMRGYELRERIGAGGFGEVYRARQPSVGREVAIKVILPQFANHPEFARRFETEAQLVARLEHPHIVPLYDYWRAPDGAYLVMRWLRGGSLHESLQRGPWSPEAALRLLDQVSTALDVAHRQGIVHRDIKPQNILLDQDGNAYLSDFGIAKDLLHATGATDPDAIPGSLGYISPEQAQSEPVTSQSDIYSLGIVMYQVLAGAHPFSDLTPADQLVKRLTEPLPPLGEKQPGLPPLLDQVIQRATALEPAQRYPDALTLAQAFREALAIPVAPELEPPRHIPAFLDETAAQDELPRPVFVARESQLDRLERFLDSSLDGQGQVVFITGGPGRGKTALMAEFARRAMDAHTDPELLVVTGNCNAYSGLGDPYLPFRDVLGMLSGDLETRWAAGAVTRDHARRLWAALPLATQALVDHGTALLDIFVPAAALLSRAETAVPAESAWLERLTALAGREQAVPGDLEQSQLFEQVVKVLRALAAQRPLLLLLDDLQWVDATSASLLFHLGRRLAGSRIMIVAAYRPEEVTLGRNGPSTGSGQRERHPLDKVLTEFKRQFGDVWVDLAEADQTQGRGFVEAFLDTEPHQLGTGFREALFRHTGGHPLFTVELLRAMQERGDLVRDDEGQWVQGPAVDWEALPGRVEGVIEERIGRLETELRDTLSVASVEGETFTAQVVARVQAIGERQILRELSRELEKRHRLVRELAGLSVGRERLLRYRFAHALFQHYLYNDLSQGERALLHREIAGVLEALYHGRTQEIAVQLARHYAEAGEGEKAIEYALQAGDQARLAYAHEEAIGHYQRALDFLKEMGQHERAARTLMNIGLTYHNAFQFQQARQAYEEGFALWQRAAAAAPATPPPAPHALRETYPGPNTLDPTLAFEHDSIFIIAQLFSGLVEFTPEMEAVPDVARSWEVSQDGRQYLFHLRDDVRWSDGTPLTAGDFEYAWKRMLDPATGSRVADFLYDIEGARAFHQGEVSDPASVGVRALDAFTLQVELEAPTSYFPLLLTSLHPVPRHVVEAHSEAWAEAENIVTNGPFRLESWQRGESMVLERYADYHGRFPGNLERIELIAPPNDDPQTRRQLYDTDRMDVLFVSLPPETDWARRQHPGEYVSAPLLTTWFVRFNTNRPPFDDHRVRRAFALAVDRERLADVVFQGNVSPATGGFVPPGMPGHSPGIGLPYDPEGARRLLAEAGYSKSGGRGLPAVEFPHGASRFIRTATEYLKAQWRENLGVEVVCEELKGKKFFDRMKHAPPHIWYNGWAADYPDPDSFLRGHIYHHFFRWHHETYDRLVEQARRILDQGERMALYRQADRILMEDALIVPLFYPRTHVLVKPWVRGIVPSPAGGGEFYKNVIIDPH